MEKRKQWCGFAARAQADHLVFLDESGVNVDMLRRYGRGRGGQRAVDHTPLNTPGSTIILSSIRLEGKMALTTFQGGTTGVKESLNKSPRGECKIKCVSNEGDDLHTIFFAKKR